MDYLLSYPRSGNTWIRFIIESISSRPTAGISGEDSAPNDVAMYLRPKFENILNHVGGDPIVEKAHFNKHISDKNGKLILILRNPKEAIIRHKNSLSISNINEYMELLETYDNWSDDKCLIYYEDLMTNPKDTISELVSFLNLDESRVSKFMDSYDSYFSISVGDYNNGDSRTKGEELIFHSKNINKNQLDIFNNHIDNMYSNLKKYINRF